MLYRIIFDMPNGSTTLRTFDSRPDLERWLRHCGPTTAKMIKHIQEAQEPNWKSIEWKVAPVLMK